MPCGCAMSSCSRFWILASGTDRIPCEVHSIGMGPTSFNQLETKKSNMKGKVNEAPLEENRHAKLSRVSTPQRSLQWTNNSFTAGLRNYTTSLNRLSLVDEHERQILQKLMDDIRKLGNERETDQHSVYAGLGEGLREGIERFEASHPRATMLMGQVVDALAKMGI